MVKDAEYLAKIKKWIEEHPNTACTGSDRLMLQREYLAAAARNGEVKSMKQAVAAVKEALRRERKVIISPESANTGKTRSSLHQNYDYCIIIFHAYAMTVYKVKRGLKAVGDSNNVSREEKKAINMLSNARNNARNNPISSAKAKETRSREKKARIAADPFYSKMQMSDAALISKFEDLFTVTPIESLGGLTLLEWAHNWMAFLDGRAYTLPLYIVYVGVTKRTLDEEAYRFLTERGANEMNAKNPSKQTNRPVLELESDPKTHLGLSYCKNTMKGKASVIWSHKLKTYCTEIEDLIQEKIMGNLGLPLGVRLFRHIAKGCKLPDPGLRTLLIFVTSSLLLLRSAVARIYLLVAASSMVVLSQRGSPSRERITVLLHNGITSSEPARITTQGGDYYVYCI